MKIFLCDFSSAELIGVAAELKKRGAEILYWTGFKEKFNDASKDKANYPQTIFHTTLDAIRGIPAANFDASDFLPPSSDLIKEMLECESTVLTMMNRMDFNRMPYAQRKNLYYKYLQYWDGSLKKLKPDAIVFSEVPHAVYNFVIYSLAKKYGIPTIMPAASTLWGWQYLLRDYNKNDQRLLSEYKKIENEKHTADDLRPELRDYYKKMTNPRHDATPILMKEFSRRMKRASLLLPKWRSAARILKSGAFLAAVKGYFNSLFNMKKQPLTLSQKDSGRLAGLFYLRRIQKIKQSFIKEYIHLQKMPDLTKKYIYFPLHAQPERTTSPLGGVYVEQILAAKTLAASIPDDWVIYIKEHPSQWSAYDSRSHLCRYENYYEELANIKNARLVPVSFSTYDLIDNSAAVAVITSSAGWEALSRSKPVLVFGYPWYADCDGVFRIDGVDACKAAVSKIAAGLIPDPQKVLNYFIAFNRIAIRTNQILRFQLYKNVTAEESVKNISEAILRELKNIKY